MNAPKSSTNRRSWVETRSLTLRTSVVPGTEGSPIGFYRRYSFVATGEVLDDEDLIELPLAR